MSVDKSTYLIIPKLKAINWFVGIILFCLLTSCSNTETEKGLARTEDTVEQFIKEDKVAIIVGVSQYSRISGLRPLNYAVNDVDALEASLSKLGYKTIVLKDTEASTSFILKRIRNIGEYFNNGKRGSGHDNGTVIFAFSGHGFKHEATNTNYLAAYNTDYDDLQNTGLSLQTVSEALKNTGARRRMMFIDACRNNPIKGKAINNPGFADYKDSEGSNILFSTRSEKVSYEVPEFKQGIFSHFLVKGLNGEAVQEDGVITFSSLTRYVQKEVKDWSLDKLPQVQVPYRSGENTGIFLIAATSKFNQAGKKDVSVVGKDETQEATNQSASEDSKNNISNNELNTQNIKSREEQTQPIEEIKKYTLTVKSVPEADSIKILNIKPRYKQSMLLEAGKYHVEASKKGYKVNRQWISLKDEGQVVEITLEKLPKGKRIGSYIDHEDGTVTDTKTGLMWKKCSEGLSGNNCSLGSVKYYSYRERKQISPKRFAGYDGWRLPTIKEIHTLVYCSNGVDPNKAWKHGCSGKDGGKGKYQEPTILQKIFPNNKIYYWSSSNFEGSEKDGAGVWYYSFYHGHGFQTYSSLTGDYEVSASVQLVRSIK